MTDRLEDIERQWKRTTWRHHDEVHGDCLYVLDNYANKWPADDIAWLIAELRETRRLGNQLADTLDVDDIRGWCVACWEGTNGQGNDLDQVAAIEAALAAWRSHQDSQ